MVVKALIFGEKKKWKLREGLGAVVSPVLSKEGVSSIYVPEARPLRGLCACSAPHCGQLSGIFFQKRWWT